MIWTPAIRHQKSSTDSFLSEFVLIVLLASLSYRLVELPSQQLTGRVSKALSSLAESRTKKRSNSDVKYDRIGSVLLMK